MFYIFIVFSYCFGFMHTTYYPLINVNLAEPDTVLFTMDILKSSTKKTFHRHTIFNNDQQLFKVTTQMIWWQPDV